MQQDIYQTPGWNKKQKLATVLFKFCPESETRASTKTQKQHGVTPLCIYTCLSFTGQSHKQTL